MRKILTFIFILCFSSLYSQELPELPEYKDLDFVLVINDKVNINVSSLKFIYRDSLGNKKATEPVGYHPGNLSILKEDYETLISERTDSIYFTFFQEEYNDTNKKEEEEDNWYEIPFSKFMLQIRFVVLFVYDLSKPEYKGVYDPLEGKNYTYELSTSEGQVLRARKSKTITK